MFLMFFSSLSYAASVDTVINIESDSFEFHPQEEKVKYEGSVETKYQGLTLQSKRLEGPEKRYNYLRVNRMETARSKAKVKQAAPNYLGPRA